MTNKTISPNWINTLYNGYQELNPPQGGLFAISMKSLFDAVFMHRYNENN
jgi:hypothetical protein